MFSISNGENYSLESISEFSRNGGSVLRSAHIGNLDPTTLLLAQEGFRVLLHEHIHGVFKGYEPAFIRKGGEKFRIATTENGKLICHSDITKTQKIDSDNPALRSMSTPFQIHYRSLKELFPASISSASEFLLEQDRFLYDMLEVLTKEYKHFFHKYADNEGNVLTYSHENEGRMIYRKDDREVQVLPSELFGLVYDYLKAVSSLRVGEGPVASPGIIMNTSLYIALATICDIYKDRKGVDRFRKEIAVMHFSGAEMMNYMLLNQRVAVRMQNEVASIYDFLYKQFTNRLPTNLEFILIPTREYRHYVGMGKKDFQGSKNIYSRDIADFTQYDLSTKRVQIPRSVFDTTYSNLKKQREKYLKKSKKSLTRNPALARFVRHISYCTPTNTSNQEILQQAQTFFARTCYSLHASKILSRVPFKDLTDGAKIHLEAREGYDNVILEITFGDPEKSMNKKEAEVLCAQLFDNLHNTAK